ncbi:hypothetical protein ABMA27_003715 [Loxostege sticticalis]|uniref:Uncharacterized protein n=1 Tax=Loxostege sticticalis TaxID=481309 RepID=A0ABR3HQ06_LOXSC
MFPNHYYLFDKNKGMPLYFYTQFFQPHILAVPVAYVQAQQFMPVASQAVRTALEPIPDDYKFTFIKKLAPPKQTPPKQSPPKQAPPLGSTPRRQNRRRLLIITKTKKIDFDLPEEFD